MRLFKKKSEKSVTPFFLSSIDDITARRFFVSSKSKKFDANTIINACATFIRRASVEPKLRFVRDGEPITGSRLEILFNKINPVYNEKAIRQAICVDLAFNGNSYLIKSLNLGGGINYLLWVPSVCIEPVPKPNSWELSHYELNWNGTTKKVSPDEVIHFRDSISADNPLKGYSPFQSLIAEVLTDEEAKEYTFWFLFNKGVIGSIISPKQEKESYARMTTEEAEELKKAFQEDFTGSNRGKALVSTFPLSVESVSINPNEMLLEKVRDIPEERISAVLNIPAAVIGLGTGLQQTKVGATLKELRQQAYDGCIAPLLSIISDTYTHKVASLYDDVEITFDYSDVKVYAEDENEKHRRVREDFRAGLLTLGQAAQLLGYEVDESEEGLRFMDLAFTTRAFEEQTINSIKESVFARARQREEAFVKAGIDLDEISRNGS